MTAEPAIFRCSICGEPSTDICVYCTKDACVNHRCDRCKRCSDCCECDVPLSAGEAYREHEESQPAPAAEPPVPHAEANTSEPVPDAPPEPLPPASDRLL